MSNGGGGYTREQWARDVLHGLGNDNPTQGQIDFLVGWSKAEGGGYAPAQGVPSYNPINTSEPMPGSTCQNCALGYHVQNYPDYRTGIDAIVKNLKGGYYPNILAYLRGQGYSGQQLVREFNMFICGSYDCHGYHYSTYGPEGLAEAGAGHGDETIPGYRPVTSTSPTIPHYTAIGPQLAHALGRGPVPIGGIPWKPPFQSSVGLPYSVQQEIQTGGGISRWPTEEHVIVGRQKPDTYVGRPYPTTHAPGHGPVPEEQVAQEPVMQGRQKQPVKLPTQPTKIYPNYVQKNIPLLTHHPSVKQTTHGSQPSRSTKISGPGHAGKPKGKAR